MVNYLFGKIYKIVGNENVYIGSTCQSLDIRLRQHNYNYKCWLNGKKVSILTSHKCVVDPNHFIELLELCQCSSKVELHNCERKWIEQLDCVNKNIPAKTQTPAEYYKENKVKIKEKQNEYNQLNKEIRKNYREQNKEKMLEYNKEYYKNNKEKLADYKKKYHQENKEKIKEKKNEYNQSNKEIQKNYREQNKEKMLEYNKEYYKNNKEKIKEMQKNNRQQNKEIKALLITIHLK